VLEIAIDAGGNTYRVVYTVSFAEAVLVLHAFMKKSKRSATTPRRDIGTINARLKAAKEQMA
jgi:phage-related protein